MNIDKFVASGEKKAAYLFTAELMRADKSWLHPAGEKLLASADRLMDMKFSFDNPWDMEQCSAVYAAQANKLRVTPNGDPEWVYMLSRMEYLNKLIWAYMLTGKPEYADTWRSFVLETWYPHYALRKEPGAVGRKISYIMYRVRRKLKIAGMPDANRTLDVAIRDYALMTGMYMLRAYGCDADWTQLLSELRSDDDFLEKRAGENIKFNENSNWGIIIASCRICVKLLTDNGDCAALLDSLLNMITRQTRDSGAHVECSPMYQAQVVISLMRVIYWCGRCNVAVPDGLREITIKSLDYLYALAGPDNYQQMIGDSDRTEMSSLFLMADHVLATRRYAPRVLKPDDIMLISEMPEALSEFMSDMRGHAGKATQTAPLELRSAEAVVLRNGGDMLTCLNMAHTSGHGHADSGSVLISLDGNQIFIDSGRYSYVNSAQRRELKGPRAHNTVSIDGGAEWKAEDAWVYSLRTTEPKLYSGDNRVRMEWRSGECTFTRHVLMLDCGVLVADVINCAGSHTIDEFLNLDRSAVLKKLCAGIFALNVAGNEYFVSAAHDGNVENSALSYCYNELEQGRRIVLSAPFTDRGVSAWFAGRVNCRLELSLDGAIAVVKLAEAGICAHMPLEYGSDALAIIEKI